MNSALHAPVRHARNAGEVACGSDLAEARIAQQCLHGLRLIMAMLECKRASSREIAARRRDDSAYGIEAVAARYECCRRLEAQVTATEMHVFLRHVRWVCDDQRERLPRNALKPVGFDESCIADAQSLRIAPRERDRGRRNVGTDDAGARSLVRDRQCDRARAATEIERRGRRLLAEPGQRQLD